MLTDSISILLIAAIALIVVSGILTVVRLLRTPPAARRYTGIIVAATSLVLMIALLVGHLATYTTSVVGFGLPSQAEVTLRTYVYQYYGDVASYVVPPDYTVTSAQRAANPQHESAAYFDATNQLWCVRVMPPIRQIDQFDHTLAILDHFFVGQIAGVWNAFEPEGNFPAENAYYFRLVGCYNG